MMGLMLLTERHAQQIAGVLSCYDRVIVQGTLPVFCYADGMTAYLSKRRIRIFDFTQFAKPLTDAIKANAEELATANGLQIDYVRKKNFSKEDRVKAVLKGAWKPPGVGVDLLGPGAVHYLPALARQEERADFSSLRRRQMPALLLLLHR
jgi:hypothetical protein